MEARAVSRFSTGLGAVVLAAVVCAACEHNPAAPGVPASITVTRNPDTLAIGSSRQFIAIGKDANGTVVAVNPTWSVQGGGGSISGAGLLTAGTLPGTYANAVRATFGSLSGTATFVVTPGPAATVTVTPTPVVLAIGGTQQFSAVVKDAAGNVLPVLPVWTVAPGVGSIGTGGLLTAGTLAGTYANGVTATVGLLSGSATVTVSAGALASLTVTPNPRVLAIGGTQQFTATGKDANGNVVAVSPTWSVQAGGGTIDVAGLFTAAGLAGTFANTVRACSTASCGAGSIAGFATVTVSPGALARITVTPDPVDLGTNAAQQFTAVGQDASGNIVPILPAPTWSVVPGYAGGTILGSGGYTAPAAAGVGFDTIRATSGGITGSARANVKETHVLVAIAVTPNPASLVAGSSRQFTATGFDATGLVVPTPGLTWSVVAGGGTIAAGSGDFSAGVATGTYPNTVRASSGGISGYATVTVTAAPPPAPTNLLGAAATHGILAGTAVTCASAPGTVNADVSVWPGLAVTGFPPCTITGGKHLGDAFAQTAQGDLTTAFLALAAMPCGTTITADLGGTTLAPGVYCSGSSVGVTGTVTLAGPASAVWVIRAPSSLTTAGSVVLTGGAQAKNVYWWVGSSATLGTGSAWQGNILALTTITLVDNATLVGRALARNGAVSLGTGNTITLP